MKYVIAGYGRFGRLALARLQEAFPETKALVIENNRDKLAVEFPSGTTVIESDAVEFLLDSDLPDADDFILPMVPFHLAAAYLTAKLPNTREIELPNEIAQAAPNPVRINFSNLLASRADFLCPDDCAEGETCTVTGKINEPLYSALAAITAPGFSVLVQRSYQILPGVGGYTFHDLITLLGRVTTGRHLVVTSCKCHAVITAIKRN
jgi:hypothetical protein